MFVYSLNAIALSYLMLQCKHAARGNVSLPTRAFYFVIQIGSVEVSLVWWHSVTALSCCCS